MFVWIAGAILLLCLGLMLSAYRRDTLGAVLLVLLPIAAAIFIFGVFRFDDAVLGNEDCVGVCVSSFSYNLAWITALGGGVVFVALLVVAVIRAAVVTGTKQERSRAPT